VQVYVDGAWQGLGYIGNGGGGRFSAVESEDYTNLANCNDVEAYYLNYRNASGQHQNWDSWGLIPAPNAGSTTVLNAYYSFADFLTYS
jgi:hypothetical protein